MVKTLINGDRGYIGSNLVAYLKQKGLEVKGEGVGNAVPFHGME